MSTGLRRLVLAVILVAAFGSDARGFLARGPVEVSVELIVQPTDGSVFTACSHTQEAPRYQKRHWWSALGNIKAPTDSAVQSGGNAIRCGDGSFENRPPEPNVGVGTPWLIIEVSTTEDLVNQMEDEKLLDLKLFVSLRRLIGFGPEGDPLYQQSSLERHLQFGDDGETFIPVAIAGGAEEPIPGQAEVFLRVAASLRRHDLGAAYGTVLVLPPMKKTEILLDGGQVGAASAGAETVLRNVRPGLRVLSGRDGSGKEVRQAVRVEAGRTVLVTLDRLRPGDGPASYRLVPLGENPQGYLEYRREVDGATVVRIPAGEFLMGNKATERAPLEHTVYVSEFLMDKTGVTWGQFKRFSAATGTPLPPHEPYWGIHDDHPAVYVTWEEAKRYCEWVGGRLPTEAEREKAARGTDGRMYPWGNEEPEPKRGVFRHTWGHQATEPVGTHPEGASPYGLLDMGGNVWELCADWYDDGYYAVSPVRDPKGPPTGLAHAARGGSWDSRPTVLSSSCRNWSHRGYREGDFGFRCAMNSPQEVSPR